MNLFKLFLWLIQIPHHIIQEVEEHIFLIFGTRWRSVVNFTPVSLTMEEEHKHWAGEWRRAPTQSNSGEQKTLPPLEVKTWFSSLPVHRIVTNYYSKNILL